MSVQCHSRMCHMPVCDMDVKNSPAELLPAKGKTTNYTATNFCLNVSTLLVSDFDPALYNATLPVLEQRHQLQEFLTQFLVSRYSARIHLTGRAGLSGRKEKQPFLFAPRKTVDQ